MKELGIDKETLWGAIFGVVAVIAALLELCLSGFEAANIAATTKDVFGTLVVFFVLVEVVKDKFPKKLDKVFEEQLDIFAKDYFPLIFKVRDFERMQNEKYEQGFCILKDLSKFIGENEMTEEEVLKYSTRNSRQTTKFIDLPSVETMLKEDFRVCFRTLQSCKYDEDFLEKVSEAINVKFEEHGYNATPRSNNLIVKIPAIKKKDQIKVLISLFEIVIIYFQIGNKGVIDK